MSQEELYLRLFRLLEKNPELTQRELSKEIGISLGKVNYCLRQLIEKGLVRAKRFAQSRDKRGYLYFLTPKGAAVKSRAMVSFLKRKIAEYEALEIEIARLREELAEEKKNSGGKLAQRGSPQ